MNKDLAIKLKNAKFPIEEGHLAEERNNSWVDIVDGEFGNWQVTDEYIYCPTLEEIIEACGEDVRMLLLHTTFIKKLSKPWEAVPNKRRRPEAKSKKGSTPIEAAALLWLELNKTNV